MRKYILLLCLLAVTCFAGDPGPKSRDVGRYRLLRGSVTHVLLPRGSTYEENCVFRIDSVTGETWTYQPFMAAFGTNAARKQFWDSIAESTTQGSWATLERDLDAFLVWADANKAGIGQYNAEQIAKRREQIEQAKQLLFPR